VLRLLLLVPTTTYRTADFLAAAQTLDVEMVVATDRPSVLEAERPENLLTLDFANPEKSAEAVARFARRHPIHAVVPVDDLTTVVGAAVAEALGLRANPVGAVATTRNKHAMREALQRARVASPPYWLFTLAADSPRAGASSGPMTPPASSPRSGESRPS